MSRIAFAREYGADCVNPRYAWSYINHEEQFVMFGAWLHLTDGSDQLILSSEWSENANGRKSNAFQPSMRHIEFVLEDGYRLFTFEQEAELKEDGIPQIRDFKRELKEKQLVQKGDDYFATDLTKSIRSFSDSARKDKLFEGEAYEVVQTVHERNADARNECLDNYGNTCVVCCFNFDKKFGAIAKGFIHVHHLIEVASRKTAYEVDPIRDLRPVCPNCHAMLHKKRPPYEIEELKDIMQTQAKKIK